LSKSIPPVLLAVGLLLLGLIIILPARSPARATTAPRTVAVPQWTGDIPIDPPAVITPDIQFDSALAIDPLNPNLVIAGFNSQHPALTNSGYGWSTDAGRTWSTGQFTEPWVPNSVPNGNVSVAFDRQGTGYYVSQFQGDSGTNGYVVLTTTTGSTWGAPRPVMVADYTQFRFHAHLAIDTRPAGPFAGSFYLVYGYIAANPLGIALRYSRDQGQTWSDDVLVSDLGHENSRSPAIATAADGSVYVAYEANPLQTVSLYLDHSTDGGATWGTDHLITGAPITRTGGLDAEGHELLIQANAAGSGVRADNAPFLGTAPITRR